jgi:bifunctional DNA-binding transcriptional regulator/antitoxin component of YhaV-PrlF toxin-antitoxin module
MAESRITSKGQTTISIEIRLHLKLKPGVTDLSRSRFIQAARRRLSVLEDH